jgi:hypothetical protein
MTALIIERTEAFVGPRAALSIEIGRQLKIRSGAACSCVTNTSLLRSTHALAVRPLALGAHRVVFLPSLDLLS